MSNAMHCIGQTKVTYKCTLMLHLDNMTQFSQESNVNIKHRTTKCPLCYTSPYSLAIDRHKILSDIQQPDDHFQHAATKYELPDAKAATASQPPVKQNKENCVTGQAQMS